MAVCRATPPGAPVTARGFLQSRGQSGEPHLQMDALVQVLKNSQALGQELEGCPSGIYGSNAGRPRLRGPPIPHTAQKPLVPPGQALPFWTQTLTGRRQVGGLPTLPPCARAGALQASENAPMPPESAPWAAAPDTARPAPTRAKVLPSAAGAAGRGVASGVGTSKKSPQGCG